MKSVKKSVKEYYEQKYDRNDNIEVIKEKANINTNKKKGFMNFMKTRKLAIISTALFIVTITAIVIGCTIHQTPQNEPVVKDTVIRLDLNPSIELTVDNNGIVASVYGANDDGKMIIVNVEDEIIGKKYDEAIDLIIEIETECGFFVKSSTNDEYNNLTITIDTEATKNAIDTMEAEIKKHVEEKLTSLNVIVNNKITFVKNNTKESLINKLLSLDESLNKDDLAELSHVELMNLITAYHLERINLPTTEIEEMYNNFKEYELNISETKIFKSFLSSASSLNTAIIENYDQLYSVAESALASLKQCYEDIFINEDSIYNKALNEVKNLKMEILKLKSEIENMEDGLEKSLKLTLLSSKETALLTAETTLQYAKETANTTLNFASSTLMQAIDSIKNFIISTEELQNIMTENANELSEKINVEKAEFIQKFENEYKQEILDQYNKLVEQKENLISQLKDQNK